MSDAMILENAWNALMEGRTADARSTLQQSTTPEIQAFARRCVGNNGDNWDDATFAQISALRDDIAKYGRVRGIRW